MINIVLSFNQVTSTEETVRTLGENMDFDASPVLRGEESLAECGERLLQEVIAVANGKLTKAEKLGNTVLAIGKIAV